MPVLSTLQIVVLAIVQGITEFLPISSSGHLLMTPHVFGWPDQGLLIDVAVHVGTLGAVIAYLWRDIVAMASGVLRPGREESKQGVKLFFYVAVASVPVVVAGLLFKLYLGDGLRTIAVTGWATLVFGVLLYLADRIGSTVRSLDHMTIGPALGIGVAQIFALIPGASRAGMTIMAARMLGFERRDAARFSMLMSIPAILGAGTLATLDLIESGNAALRADAALAAVLAFCTALIAIAAMMRWLSRATFTPFVIYRIVLGAAILIWWYS